MDWWLNSATHPTKQEWPPDGYGLGTLCAIDTKARELSEAERQILIELATLACSALEIHRRLHSLSLLHDSQGEKQEHKELLASMVVHDLRNPLGAIPMGASSEYAWPSSNPS